MRASPLEGGYRGVQGWFWVGLSICARGAGGYVVAGLGARAPHDDFIMKIHMNFHITDCRRK